MNSDFLEIALTLAHQASTLVMDYLHKPIQKSQQADSSWLTDADLESDKIIREGLLKNFPDHAIITEETGLLGNKNSDWTWLIDPLDGTKAYAKGIPGFSVMIGLLYQSQPYLGVVVDPIQKITYEAVKGQGAFMTLAAKRSQLKVSERKDFSKMPLVHSPGIPEEKLKQVLDQLHCPVIEPINSVGIKVGHLVRQEADIYLNHHSCHYWDTAAPQIILEEAGGIFTKIDGSALVYAIDHGDYDHHSPSIASNNTQHSQIVDMVSAVEP
ncbi:MAG: hypothetical protein IPJ69_06445 [Deltaproteobacteria bacterium]|nr:MAG: hypothetical protein IPJ69_06445 [Deltaproteobacteria bacterium]